MENIFGGGNAREGIVLKVLRNGALQQDRGGVKAGCKAYVAFGAVDLEGDKGRERLPRRLFLGCAGSGYNVQFAFS